MMRPPQDNDPFETLLSVVGCVLLFIVAMGWLIVAALFGGTNLK